MKFTESALDAMIREAKEETGLQYLGWRMFCLMHDGPNIVNCFYTITDLEPRQTTDERIEHVRFTNLWETYDALPNVVSLIYMARMAMLANSPVQPPKGAFSISTWKLGEISF
jgi:8-oxo-dGTP pyrophosphatase MutT (NUDIX family)